MADADPIQPIDVLQEVRLEVFRRFPLIPVSGLRKNSPRSWTNRYRNLLNI